MKEFVIPIIVHDPELPVPEHKNWGDWVDLRSAEDVEMKQGEYRIISLGVSMRLPYGFEAHWTGSTPPTLRITKTSASSLRTASGLLITAITAMTMCGASLPLP